MSEKKRVLVWIQSELKERNGGPSSYLFNLSQYLNSSNFSIDYLPDLIKVNTSGVPQINQKSSISYKQKLKGLIPSTFKEKLRVKRSFKLALENYAPKAEVFNEIDINNYEVIHFHSTLDLVQVSNALRNFKGKILLTPHTPCPPYEHELNHLNLSLINLKEEDYNKIISLDLIAFQRADYLVLPSIQAISSYYEGYNRVTDFKSLIESKKIIEIPTGVPSSGSLKSREQIRKQLQIPNDAFVVHFGGRHNEEKGYDLLVKLGETIFKDNSSFYFLITGKTNDEIQYPKHDNWIEVGWTTDPFSYANASDLFILPNKVSYFDLILIEMMAIGLPILLSDVGGNQYFKKFNSELDFCYFEPGNLLDLKNKLLEFSSTDLSKRNQKFYEGNLTIQHMTEGFRKLYSNLLDV